MPDDLRIPDVAPDMRARAPLSRGYDVGGGYRARQIGRGHGHGLDYVKLGAAGLAALLLLGAIGYAVLGRHSATIPVIEADSRPIRVKPDNPGGMQIAGADETTLGDERSSHDGMAPSAEVPAPQALRAQMQQAAPVAPATAQPAVTLPDTSAANPAPGPAPVTASPSAAPPPKAPATTLSGTAASPLSGTAASPLSDTPSLPSGKAAAAPIRTVAKDTPEKAATTAGTPSARPTPAPATPAGTTPVATTPVATTIVQLGALSSEAAAHAEWQRLAHSAPGLLDGREQTVTKIERDGRTYWRLRTGGFADVAEATGFCAKLKAKGGTCAIASF